MATYLDRIVAEHRAEAAADTRDLGELRERALARPPARGFRDALVAPGLAVIAEVKRRSPSKGDLFGDLDPATLAAHYAGGGASCLSVLTDAPNFGGSPEDLQAARAAVALPALRKDFTVHERDVLDARLMGADAVLLIAAALDDDEMSRFHSLAVDVGRARLRATHHPAGRAAWHGPVRGCRSLTEAAHDAGAQ